MIRMIGTMMIQIEDENIKRQLENLRNIYDEVNLYHWKK